MAALQQSTPPAPHRRAPPPLDRAALLRRREAPPSCSMVGRTHSFDHNHHRVAPAAATSPPTVSPSAGSFTTSGALSSRASVGAAPIPSHRRAPPPPPAYASSTVRRDASVPPGDAPAPAMSCTTSHGTVTAARMTRIAHGYEAPRVRVPGSFCGIQAGAAAPYGMSACEGMTTDAASALGSATRGEHLGRHRRDLGQRWMPERQQTTACGGGGWPSAGTAAQEGSWRVEAPLVGNALVGNELVEDELVEDELVDDSRADRSTGRGRAAGPGANGGAQRFVDVEEPITEVPQLESNRSGLPQYPLALSFLSDGISCHLITAYHGHLIRNHGIPPPLPHHDDHHSIRPQHPASTSHHSVLIWQELSATTTAARNRNIAPRHKPVPAWSSRSGLGW